MKFVADFHLHSKYSRATSPKMHLDNLDKWAQIKGVKVLTTGDFTHPGWFEAVRDNLHPVEEGLFQIKNKKSETYFILTTEISCIYSKKGRVRKVHILIFAPSFKVAERINKQLTSLGNLSADGRPILGLDAKELLKIVMGVSENCLVVPAHIMTPWFALFGSKSGFDSLKDCFEEYSKYIFALETGLSADPEMIWRLSEGQKLTLISNSDAHSPQNIGREANVFDTEITYPGIIEAIKSRDKEKLLYTIEFFPQEGKYHYDGHRDCGIRLSPSETKKYNNICPRCGKPLTVGVLNRIEQLAVSPSGFKPQGSPSFKSLVPLKEIIGEALQVGPGSKKVGKEYMSLIKKFGSELNILLDVSQEELKDATLSEVAEGIRRVREGEVFVEPGYDGVYGKVKIFSEGEQESFCEQQTLF